MAYTLQQLQQMGAKPVTAPSSPPKQGASYTIDQLQTMGAQPVNESVPIAPTEEKKPTSILGKIGSFLAPTLTRTLSKDIAHGEHVTGRDILGSALEVGSFALPFGAVAKGVGLGARALGLAGRVAAPVTEKFAVPVIQKAATTLGRRALQTAGEAAVSGGLYEAGQAVGEGAGLGETTKRAVTGAAISAPLGAALPYAGAAFRGVKNVVQSVAGKTPVTKARTVIEDAFRNTAKRYQVPSRTLSAMETKAKTKPIEVISSYGNEIPKLIDSEMTDGKVNPSGAQDFIKDKISQYSGIKNDIVQANEQAVPIEELRRKTIELTNKQPWSNLKKSQSLGQSDKVFGDLEKVYSDGQIPLTQIDKIKTEQTALSKAYNNQGRQPFEYDAHGILGKAARKIVEDTTNDPVIKELNQFIQSHYDAIDFLETLRGKTPHGGRMTKITSRLGGEITGAIAGGSVGHPFLGAIMGRLGSDAIFNILGNNLISSPLKRTMIRGLEEVDSAAVKAALQYLETTAKAKSSLLLLGPGTGEKVLNEGRPIPVLPSGKAIDYTGQGIAIGKYTPHQRSIPVAEEIRKNSTSANKTASNISIPPIISSAEKTGKRSVFGKPKNIKPKNIFGKK